MAGYGIGLEPALLIRAMHSQKLSADLTTEMWEHCRVGRYAGMEYDPMGPDELQQLTAISKYVFLPAIGFLAGFLSKWFLQERKARDELVNALSSSRADALRELWAITTLRPEIASLKEGSSVPPDALKQTNAEILDWYTRKGGALFLSWQATQLIFQLLDTLRDNTVQKDQLEKSVSALRTRLKRDCGIYSYWEEKRMLKRPRPSPWPAETK
jgi:hypothetical protein